MCGWEFSETWLDKILELIGAEKILFGTDNPWHNPAYSLGRIAYAKISDKEKEKILGGNFKRLVGEKF